MIKEEINKDDVIIEDVIWYNIKEKNGEKIYTNLAKSCFYYQFLMERADGSINGQYNRKAATDFFNYEEIYIFLLSKGILNSSKYCLDWTEISGGATFSFNLTKAKQDINLEEVLLENLKNMSEYIITFCNPAESFRCNICGAVSLSRNISFGYGNDRITFCLACHPIKDEIQKDIQKVYKKYGSLAATKERLSIIEKAAKAKIAEDKTINILLDEYKLNNKTDFPSPKIEIINQILREKNLDEFEAFSCEDFEIVIWNRKRLSDLDIFSDTVSLSDEGDEIVVLFNKAGVCYLDEKAISFARKAAKNTKFIFQLK